MYTCIHIYMYIHVHIFENICMYMYIFMLLCLCTHAYILCTFVVVFVSRYNKDHINSLIILSYLIANNSLVLNHDIFFSGIINSLSIYHLSPHTHTHTHTHTNI